MIKIKILLYGDILILDCDDNLLIRIKRTFKWNSKISLAFYKNDILILETSHYSFLPFVVENINYQKLEKKISFKNIQGKEVLLFGTTEISIKHKFDYLIYKELCNILIDGKVIGNVKIESLLSTKNITLTVIFKEKIDYHIQELCLINLAIKYSDIDGN